MYPKFDSGAEELGGTFSYRKIVTFDTFLGQASCEKVISGKHFDEGLKVRVRCTAAFGNRSV